MWTNPSKKIQAVVRPPPIQAMPVFWKEWYGTPSLWAGIKRTSQVIRPLTFFAEFLTANLLARGGGGVDSSPKSLVPGQMTDDAKYFLM